MVELVERHLRGFFNGHASGITCRLHQPTDAPPCNVMVFEPGPRTELYTYASLGACRTPSTPAHEFFVLASEPDPAHVELVTMAAYYHATPDPTCRLGLGHTVPIGRPWLPGSQCSHLLVSLPYPFGPELERCSEGDSLVQFLWLLPITDDELAFKKKHALEALERRFDEAKLEYWDAARRSVVLSEEDCR